jgi:2-dehydropantoate 2-reductase
MRIVVYGAGAVGGVVGARLSQAGHDVTLIARGAHLDAIRAGGLTVRSPSGEQTIDVAAAASPAEAGLGPGSDRVVLLAMKSNDTVPALNALRAVAGDPSSVAVVCLQNGVANERAALRRFPNVYGISAMCPTAHLEPGVVDAFAAPVEGILDIGRVPAGVDATAESVAAALSSATFVSEPRHDIMRWKYGKLLLNLANAVDAVVAMSDEAQASSVKRLIDLARAEGEACLVAAGIDFVSEPEERARREELGVRPGTAGGRRGASSWQSLARGTGSIEADYLNGEIVLLGRQLGIPTPVNELLQRMANGLAARREPPGSRTAAELLDQL